jgi:hypothetical protein
MENNEVRDLPMNDDEMMITDLMAYMAGQLDIYYQCVDAGHMTMQEVAEKMDLRLIDLHVNRCIWNVGGIMARRETMKAMMSERAKESKE